MVAVINQQEGMFDENLMMAVDSPTHVPIAGHSLSVAVRCYVNKAIVLAQQAANYAIDSVCVLPHVSHSFSIQRPNILGQIHRFWYVASFEVHVRGASRCFRTGQMHAARVRF